MRKIRELFNPDGTPKDNIIDRLSEEQENRMTTEIDDGYEADKASCAEWKEKVEKALNLAEQAWEPKDWPFTGAANIKYPLIATASIQFAARAYPNFVKGPEVVKALVVGNDPTGQKAQKASRVAQHMSYQLLNEMEEWEDDTDKLLTYLPIVGCAFKKTYYSQTLHRPVSCFRRATDVIIDYWARSVETAPRITEVFTLYPNEIEERIRRKLYRDFDYGVPSEKREEVKDASSFDSEREHLFLEQHMWFDLDDDGYKEPYIATFHKDSKKIVRLVPRFWPESIEEKNDKIVRIEPDQYYTKFSFMPSIRGSVYDTGFGLLLEPINRTINSTLNQLVDSGTLYNLNGGFIGKGLQLGRGRGGGKIEFEPGEWKPVNFVGDDIRKHLVPLPVKPPSGELFNLLSFMVGAGERLSSVTEILTGEQSNESERPTTTLARIEQGLKVFSSIYKRLYRAFKLEYKKIFAINRRYLKEQDYFRILDMQIQVPKLPPEVAAQDPMAAQELAIQAQRVTQTLMVEIMRADYDYQSCDIVPVADPNEITNTQKLIKAQMLIPMRGTGLNDAEIMRRFLEGIQEPEPEKLLNAPPPPPDPKFVLESRKLAIEEAKFQLEAIMYAEGRPERMAKVGKLVAQATKDIAAAESMEAGDQLEQYKAKVETLTKEFNMLFDMKQQAMEGRANGQNQQAGMEGMAAQSGNAGGAEGAGMEAEQIGPQLGAGGGVRGPEPVPGGGGQV